MTNDAAPGDVPVNLAPPQWHCPHCRTNYYSDLTRATECAQAGPADAAPDGVPVLVLPSHRSMDGTGPATFGLSKAGPVRAETVDGERRHRRDVTVGELVVNARALVSETPTDLVVLVNERDVDSDHSVVIGPNGYGTLDKLFRFDATGRSRSEPLVWLPTHHGEAMWWRAPNEQERETINMLTVNLLDRVASMDVDAFAAKVEASYHRESRSRLGDSVLASPTAALAVAQAHGAPSHIWALRWLSMHAAEVARWQAQTAIAWAAGTGGPLPLANALRVSDALPKNPGKKRLALMDPYETDHYAGAMRALGNLLSVDAPSMPVPGLGDVVADLRNNRKESHGVH